MGCTATGVRGMRVANGERVVSMIVVDGEGDILTASEKGFGKRTGQSEYPRKGRGTQGVIALQTSDRNGKLVGAIQLTERHEILLISDQGTLVRTRASEVSQVGRNTQGVTLMRVAGDEKLIAVERLDVVEVDELPVGELLAAASTDADPDGAGAEPAAPLQSIRCPRRDRSRALPNFAHTSTCWRKLPMSSGCPA